MKCYRDKLGGLIDVDVFDWAEPGLCGEHCACPTCKLGQLICDAFDIDGELESLDAGGWVDPRVVEAWTFEA